LNAQFISGCGKTIMLNDLNKQADIIQIHKAPEDIKNKEK
jgi:ABC-type phosphate transport system ATPase subunit